MRPRTQLIVAAALALLGVLCLVAVVVRSGGSVRETIDDRYRQVSSSDGGRSRIYETSDPASKVVSDITRRWKPADTVIDPSGTYLRYHDTVVAVLPQASSSTRIYVDDERRGYSRWVGYVGGRWGTYTGAGDGFRGGGPGAGK